MEFLIGRDFLAKRIVSVSYMRDSTVDPLFTFAQVTCLLKP